MKEFLMNNDAVILGMVALIVALLNICHSRAAAKKQAVENQKQFKRDKLEELLVELQSVETYLRNMYLFYLKTDWSLTNTKPMAESPVDKVRVIVCLYFKKLEPAMIEFANATVKHNNFLIGYFRQSTRTKPQDSECDGLLNLALSKKESLMKECVEMSKSLD